VLSCDTPEWQGERFIALRVGVALGERIEHADAPHPVALLRPRSERPRRRTAERG
jgi:hypothetical protein